MGLFSGKNFSLKNVVTMPFDIAKNDLSFFNELRKDPKGAFGRKQEGMTKILGGVGFNEDSKINKNSDAIMATVLGGIVAGGAMGGGAAAGGQAGAAGAGGAAQAGGATAGQTAATTGGQSTLASGSWLNNPYVQAGQQMYQQQQANQQNLLAQSRPQMMQSGGLMRQAQQDQGTGYQYRGLLT